MRAPLNQVRWFVRQMEVQSFRFAKTMPRFPHWYTLRKTWNDDTAFDQCVQFIREHGRNEPFFGKPFLKLNVNGYKYWSMGAPVADTILINRAEAQYVTDFCDVAETYDVMFEDAASQQENQEVALAVGDVSGKRILDIGAGTGVFLDMRGDEIGPENYVAVEPSRPMAEQLSLKHPTFSRSIVPTTFEDYADGGFDLIVSLFGAPSYIPPACLSCRLPEMLTATGRYFLMFYHDDYTKPVSCVSGGGESHHFKGGYTSLRGECRDFHNFIICTGPS